MLRWDDAALIEKITKAAQRGVVIGANIVGNEAVRRIQGGPKTGRIYRRKGVTHKASAPGESPASDTGRLAQSKKITVLPGGLAARVTFGTVYARALENGSAYIISRAPTLPLRQSARLARQYEFGTQTLAPRPFLRVSLFEKQQEVEAAIVGEVRAAIGKSPPASTQLALF